MNDVVYSFDTSSLIAGAGRITTFTNIEAIEVDGGGGPDVIYVLSTNAEFSTTIVGGSGDGTADNDISAHVGVSLFMSLLQGIVAPPGGVRQRRTATSLWSDIICDGAVRERLA